MNTILMKEVTPENIVEVILSSNEAWTTVERFINDVMHKKEQEERRRQGAIQQ